MTSAAVKPRVASVLVNWGWNYVTWDRGTRLILEPARPREDNG